MVNKLTVQSPIPKNITKALNKPEWATAVNKEVQSFVDLDVYEEYHPQEKDDPIYVSNWYLFSMKHDQFNHKEIEKARLIHVVPEEVRKKLGDSSPVVKNQTLMLFWNLYAELKVHGYNFLTMDISTAFLTAEIDINEQKTKRASSDSEDSEDENVGTGSDVDEDELLKQYEGMVALSEDEDGDAEKDGDVTLNSDVDYNQVTDLEPSEVDDDDLDLDEEEQPSKKKQKTADDKKKKDKKEKKKTVLPALEYGFIDQDGYSGDEEDVEEDPFFEDIKPKKVVKNRKGQRQRRLLWEKKYGKEAKHIQVEITKRRGEREQRQKEFEEREAKRHERMKEKFEHYRAKYVKKKEFESKDFHPSWEAKKAQEEKTKNIKFSGKKVVFD